MAPKDPDSVKSAIRSVLIAQPKAILLSKFVKEFQEFNGYRIPFEEFGFRTLIEYLMSLKDAVAVVPLTGSRDFLLTGIADTKNAHVKKLVNHQKSASKSGDPLMRKLNYADKIKLSNTLAVINNITNDQVRKQELNTSGPCPSSSRQHAGQDSAPKSANEAGKPPREAVRSKPPLQQSKPVKTAETEPPRLELQSNRQAKMREYPEPRSIPELKKIVRELLSDFPEGLDARLFADCYHDKFGHPIIPQRFNANSVHELLAMTSMSSVIRLRHDPVRKSATVILRSGGEEEVEELSSRQIQERAKELKKKLIELCDHHRKDGINLSNFDVEFRRQFGTRLYTSFLGMEGSSIAEILHNFSDVIKLENYSTEHEKGTVVYRVGYRPKWMKPKVPLIVVPSKVKENLSTLLKFYQQHGIYEDKLANAYHTVFYSEIDWKTYGFPSLTVLVDSLQGEILTKSADSNGRAVINFLPFEKRDQKFLPLPAEEFSQSLVPDGVVHPLERFEPAVFPMELTKGSEIYLTAGEVMSPSNFYFHLVGSNCRSELDDLLDELDIFYQKYHQEYQVPKDQIVAGMYMVSEWEGCWYRGRITHIQDLNNVRVLYYDYGTREGIPMSAVHYMHKRFHKLPPQGYIGRLAGIVPVDCEGQQSEVWRQEAKNLFLNWFKDRALFGYVFNVDRQEGSTTEIIDLELHYTHADPDFCINDELVRLGYARHNFKTAPPPEVVVPRPTGPSRCLQEAEMQHSVQSFPDVVSDTVSSAGGVLATSPVVINLLASPLRGQLSEIQIKYLLSMEFQSMTHTEQLHYISNLLQSNTTFLQYEAYNQALAHYISTMMGQMSIRSQPPQLSWYPGLNVSPLPGRSFHDPSSNNFAVGSLFVQTSPDGRKVYETGGGVTGLLMPAKDQSASMTNSSPAQNVQQSVKPEVSPAGKVPPPKIIRVPGFVELFVLRFEDGVYIPAQCLAQNIATAVSPRAMELQFKFKRSNVAPKKLKVSDPSNEDVVLSLLRTDVPGLFLNDNDTVEFYHIYRLSSMAGILDGLGVTSDESRRAFMDLMTNYAMDSKVWSET